MTSLVMELQHDALDENVQLSAILRKTMVVARKLDVPELITWCKSELDGYSGERIPDYRKVKGLVKAHNPYNGLMLPIVWTSEPPEELISRYIGQSIPELQEMAGRPQSGTLIVPFPEPLGYKLMADWDTPTPPVLVVDRSQVISILDRVRSLVLDWSLKLESKGIIGSGMTFSKEEKQTARQSHINIETFQGILGDINQSTVSQSLSITKGDSEALANFLKESGVSDKDIKELQSAIKSDGTKAGNHFGPRVSEWIGKMVSKAAEGSWKVGIAAGGNLLAPAIKGYLGI
jgi:hypothetical protein